MPASTYEYKTVALPQIVQGKRKRGISEADVVAETFGEVIHLEAVDGWEYMRADILSAGTRGGMFSKEPVVTHYSVLVFRRTLESAWPMHQNDGNRNDGHRKDGQRGAGNRNDGYRSRSEGNGRDDDRSDRYRADERDEEVRPIPAPPPPPSTRTSSPSGSAASAGSSPSAPVRPRPAPVAPRDPIVPAAPAASAPVRRAPPPPPIADPTSPLAQGMVLSTGGQFRSEGSSTTGSKPAAPSSPGSATPRPPLGSAQD